MRYLLLIYEVERNTQASPEEAMASSMRYAAFTREVRENGQFRGRGKHAGMHRRPLSAVRHAEQAQTRVGSLGFRAAGHDRGCLVGASIIDDEDRPGVAELADRFRARTRGTRALQVAE